MSVHLRGALPSDALSVAEVHVEAWKAAYRGYMPDTYLDGLSVEARTALWQRSLSQPNPGTMIVADNEGAVDAFCLFGPTRDADGKGKQTGEIVSLNVRPQLWRRGIGRALCAFVLREAPHRNWTTITHWVLKGNERACRFYEALGFWLDGTERTENSLIGSPLRETRICAVASRHGTPAFKAIWHVSP